VALLASLACGGADPPLEEVVCDRACSCTDGGLVRCTIRTADDAFYFLQPARDNCERAVGARVAELVDEQRCRNALGAAEIVSCALRLPEECAALLAE
jgi:hypothetical protein